MTKENEEICNELNLNSSTMTVTTLRYAVEEKLDKAKANLLRCPVEGVLEAKKLYIAMQDLYNRYMEINFN